MHFSVEDINTSGVICQQYISKCIREMEIANCWVSSERTKLRWKECRPYLLQSFSPCFYKTRTHLNTTKIENRKGAGAQINLPRICCSLAALWPYTSQHKAPHTSSGGGGGGGKACLKLRANRRLKSHMTIAMSMNEMPENITQRW